MTINYQTSVPFYHKMCMVIYIRGILIPILNSQTMQSQDFCINIAIHCMMAFVCLVFFVPLVNFSLIWSRHSYGDITITGEWLQILTFTQHLWPLSSEGSLACHTYWDTRLPLIMVISEDP